MPDGSTAFLSVSMVDGRRSHTSQRPTTCHDGIFRSVRNRNNIFSVKQGRPLRLTSLAFMVNFPPRRGQWFSPRSSAAVANGLTTLRGRSFASRRQSLGGPVTHSPHFVPLLRPKLPTAHTAADHCSGCRRSPRSCRFRHEHTPPRFKNNPTLEARCLVLLFLFSQLRLDTDLLRLSSRVIHRSPSFFCPHASRARNDGAGDVPTAGGLGLYFGLLSRLVEKEDPRGRSYPRRLKRSFDRRGGSHDGCDCRGCACAGRGSLYGSAFFCRLLPSGHTELPRPQYKRSS